ncbi:hypothetical protein [Mycobacteroides stephanolepidis]|nr:hypothetical protein [[Mycobacterium] stephanolepidis]
MANPAELLYLQLKAWNLSGSRDSAEGRRQLRVDVTMAIRRHEAALSNWRATSELLDEAEKLGQIPVDVVNTYRQHLPTWGSMVLSFPDGWKTVYSFDYAAMQMLSTLGHQLDSLVPKLPDGAADDFEKALEKVLTALKDDPSISEGVKKYMVGLIIHMKLVIEEYRLNIRGDYDLSRAATLLKSTIDTAYQASSDEHKGVWEKLKGLFSWKSVAKAGVEMTPTLVAMIAQSGG